MGPALVAALQLGLAGMHMVAGHGLLLAPLLRDPPLLGDMGNAQLLDGNEWTARSFGDGAVTLSAATVPGDLVTDLERAGVVDDPLRDVNWRDQAGAWERPGGWSYTRMFAVNVVDADGTNDDNDSTLLVLDGIKMAADVFLNGVLLSGDGVVDQHLRYEFEVRRLLVHNGDKNNLTIHFPTPSADSRNDEGRYMACSGGWDWSQYSTTETLGGLQYLSLGVWKSVYLLHVHRLSLRAMTAHVFYEGEYPAAPLTDATAGAWTVRVTAHVAAGAKHVAAGTVFEASIRGLPAVQNTTSTLNTALVPGEEANVTMTLAVPAGAVRLWWPNGVFASRGVKQPLYTVALRSPGFADTRRIGFRTIALVTDDTSRPAALANLSGSGNLTLRYVVNGAPLYTRGSNVIPLDEFAGRADARALQLHVASAAAAGMNLLLIWGGGIFQYEAFYNAADEAGLLLYHDLMYSSEGKSTHLCAETETQHREIVANVRRLSSHASVAVWAGGNEIGGSGIYSSFALSIVRQQDSSRPIWPASPAGGWASGVDRLWGRPRLDEPLVARLNTSEQPDPRVQLNTYYMGFQGGIATAHNISHCSSLCGATPGCTVARFRGEHQDNCAFVGFGHPVSGWGMPSMDTVWPPATALPVRAAPAECIVETHGPYIGGRGWPAVNSGNSSVVTPFDPATPPHFPPQPQPMGLQLPGYFHSEFGPTSFSSFESMSATLSGPQNWGAHAPAMYWRSYSQDNIVATYFGHGDGAAVNMSVVGDAKVFARQLLLSQLASALVVKSEVETQRAQNDYGTMLWQLGEIFPTGT